MSVTLAGGIHETRKLMTVPHLRVGQVRVQVSSKVFTAQFLPALTPTVSAKAVLTEDDKRFLFIVQAHGLDTLMMAPLRGGSPKRLLEIVPQTISP